MAAYRYLIVGGGMTGDSACRGIRDHDTDGTIGMFGAEAHEPYVRPPLTKGLWSGKEEASIFRGTPELGVDVHAGRRVVSLDFDARTATDDTGESHSYEKLLLATGGVPRQLPGDASDVIYFRTLDDYRRLRGLAGDGVRVAVIGGGFIGSEIAAALTTNGCAVTIVFPEPGIGARLFPPELSAFVNDYYREKGVTVLAEELVETISSGTVTTKQGTVVEADAIVAGLGIVPATDLAEAAGLDVDDGILVDELGRAGAATTCTRPETSPASRCPRSAGRGASSTRITRTRTDVRWAPTWPAPGSRTTTSRSSTPTCSTSVTRLWETSTRVSTRSRSGPSRTARESSPTSTATARRAGSCSGTSGARSTPRVS